METFASRLRTSRLARGWTQEQFARLLDVSSMTVSRWERGEQQPDLDSLKLVATTLEVSTDFLVTGTGATGTDAAS
jgi:transcriptional regulator with XRE-family HTH domain